MSKKIIVLFVLIILSTLFILYSCNEPTSVESKKNEKQENPVLKKETTKNNNTATTETGKLLGYKVVEQNGKKVKVPVYEDTPNRNIQPDKFYAGYGSYWYIYYWKFDHYEPISGSLLGIWPYDNMWTNDFISRLKNKWGFKGIFTNTSNRHQIAINAGFNFKFMMVPVDPNNYQDRIGNLDYLANTYYSDEPFHLNCKPHTYKHPEWDGKLYMLSIIRNYANAHGAKYAISNYFDCSHVIEYAQDVDFLMFDGYREMDQVRDTDCFWSPYEDQTNTLDRWFNEFGNKAGRFWVSTGIITDGKNDNDDNEFDQLFGWANSRGFRTGGGQIWLYTGSTANENNVSLFCSSAYQAGWLKRFQRQWAHKYKCINPEGTYTFPPGPDWQYIGDVSTDVVEER